MIDSLSSKIKPDIFTFQWHLTDRCNWSCRHCYREDKIEKDISFAVIKKIASDCVNFFNFFKLQKPLARISFSGGEPFLRDDLFEIISLFENKPVELILMTNGSLINKEKAKKIKKMKINRVQLSLEGMKNKNDSIRGKGTFDIIAKAIKILKENGVRVSVSVTVHKQNLSDIEQLAFYLKKIGVSRLGLRRYVPLGRGGQVSRYMLSRDELKDFYFRREEIKKKLEERNKFEIGMGCEDAISYYLLSKNRKKKYLNKCAITKGEALTISSRGKVLLCRRLPKVVGDAKKESLLDIYFSSDKLWRYRSEFDVYCKSCPVFKNCLSGARCIADSLGNGVNEHDPYCFRAENTIIKADKTL